MFRQPLLRLSPIAKSSGLQQQLISHRWRTIGIITDNYEPQQHRRYHNAAGLRSTCSSSKASMSPTTITRSTCIYSSPSLPLSSLPHSPIICRYFAVQRTTAVDSDTNNTKITNTNTSNTNSTTNNSNSSSPISSSSSSGSSPSSAVPVSESSIRRLIRLYGPVAVGTYLTIYVSTLGLLFICIKERWLGVGDIQSIVEWLGLQDWLERMDSRTGDFAVAWIATKFTEPIRLALTGAITPTIARMIGRAPPKEDKSQREQ